MDVPKVLESIGDEIVEVLVFVVELETNSVFVGTAMRVDLLKAVVGLVVEIVDVVISEVEIDIVAVFVDVDLLKVIAGIFEKIVDV